MQCRMCKNSNLYEFLDLGHTPAADEFKTLQQLKDPEIYYPLKVCVCDDCGLVQLTHVVAPEILYQNDYPYESSTTITGQMHWKRFSEAVVGRFSLGKNDLVVDIGSNVGVLLQKFKDQGVRVHGIDPAANIVEIANDNGIDTTCGFVGIESVCEVVEKTGRASVITGSNVFAHIDDLYEFMGAVGELLNESGVLILEFPYLTSLFSNLEYDTIYHEHLSYISVKPLLNFFPKFGMELFDVEKMEIHGGSIRIYVGKTGLHNVEPIVQELVDKEQADGVYEHEYLDEFSRKVAKNKEEINSLFCRLKYEGKQLAALSAPAKGMTLLNYCGIRNDTLDFVSEKSQLKIGKYTPGGHIPVVSDDELIERAPDYALLLAWNFADEIIANLSEFRKKGGKFIIPIPMPRIIE